MQVHEDYITHPGQVVTNDMKTTIVVALDDDYGENPESIFYEGTEV